MTDSYLLTCCLLLLLFVIHPCSSHEWKIKTELSVRLRMRLFGEYFVTDCFDPKRSSSTTWNVLSTVFLVIQFRLCDFLTPYWINTRITSADIKEGLIMQRNTPDSATSSSGPSPPPAAAGASASQRTGSLAPGSTGYGPSSSDATPCCYRWPQLIGCSLPLLPVRRHAESRLRETSSCSDWVLTRGSHDGSRCFINTNVAKNRKHRENKSKVIWECDPVTFSELISGNELILDQSNTELNIVCQPAVCVNNTPNPA